MKNIIRLLSVLACLAFVGCSSVDLAEKNGSFVQKALDKTLPASFTGRFEGGHKNVYFDFEIVADGLKRTELGWTWSYLKYKRNGRFSSGWIVLGTPPPSP